MIITGNDQQRNISINLDWDFTQNFIRAQSSDWWFLNKDQFPNDPKEWFDSDRDGIGDNSDDNDDSDSLDDKEELLLGLNPYKGDTDGDRVNDSDDKMPLDPASYQDMDGDGIPDYRWLDNNNDGRFTLDWGGEDGDPIVVDLDRDGDGILNTNEDPSQGQTHPDNDDTDNDGYKDGDDLFPFNPNAHADFDNDGIADYYDFDDDNDGFSDKDEAYSKTDPNDANKYPEVDVDKDFMSDPYESSAGTNPTVNDSDNDGFNDGIDVFPMDKYEWIDSDADGEGNNRDNNDDNDAVIDYWEKIGITHGYYSGNISTTIWNRDIDLIGADDEDLRDSDNDRVPDLIEKKAAALFKDMFDNGSDQYKRAVWRMHEGINNWDDPDGDNNRNFVLYDANIDRKNPDTEDDHDADGVYEGSIDRKNPDYVATVGDDKDNALAIIDWDDWDDDGLDNWYDEHSDGHHDSHDGAPFDSRDHRDLDGDFIGDGNDLDRDGDTIHNDSERDNGSDPELYDTDRDGVNDALDYYAHDKRYWNKDQFIGTPLFTIKQIGNSTNWESISTWNSGQIGSSMAAINNLGELYVWGLNYGSLPFKASNENQYSGLPLKRVYKNWNSGISDAFIVGPDPVKIRNEIKWKKISLGKGFGLGTDDEDKIYSWGINLSSQLGIGKPTTFVDFTSPKLYLGDIKMISAGDQQAGIINEDGKLRMIGSNDQGQLGTGASPFNYPRELDWTEISADIKKVRVTFTETQILDSQGYIWAYGDNDYGQLGRGLANTAAENFTVGKVLDVQGQEVSSNQWTDIYSYSQQAYAFKLEGNEENLYAWGNNENYALGIDKSKSEYPNQIPFESTPVKVENIVKSEILVTDEELQFTPVNGGFIFIKKNVSPNPTDQGELWGVGENFYTGRFNKYKKPSRIGKDNDWVKIHDLRGAIKNILLKKKDGSTWGAGENNNLILTNTPCPDPLTAKQSIYLTTKRQKQVFEIELSSQYQGTASITINIGGISLNSSVGSITTTQIGSTTLITRVSTVTTNVSSVVSQFTADILSNNLGQSFTISQTTLSSGNRKYRFEAINYTNYNTKFSISNRSDVFTGTVTITEITKNYSGETTYSIFVNGTEISKAIGTNNSFTEDQIRTEFYTHVKTELNNKSKFPFELNIREFTDQSGTTTDTNDDKIRLQIERTDYQDLDVKASIKLSGASSSTIIIGADEDRENTSFDSNCNNYAQFHNKLVEIFTKDEYRWKKLSVGKNHVVGLTSSGTIYTWGGQNNEGQLGYGNRNDNPTRGVPKIVDGIKDIVFKDISASEEMSFAIALDGTLYAWGDNDLGSLGDGTNIDALQPVTVSSTLKFNKILGGHKFQVALTTNNTVVGWGYQKYGDLGALGKVKSDVVSISSTLTESEGIVKTTPDGEYLLVTKTLENYINTKLNYEYNNNGNRGQLSKKMTTQTSSKKSSKSKSRGKTSKLTNVGKWKVKKKKSGFKGKSAVSRDDLSGGIEMPYNFDIVDVNEKPDNIDLSDISSKITKKGEQFISNITVTDPDEDDIIELTIPSNSPNASKFEIKNQKLYYNSSTNKANVPVSLIIRATDWEGLSFEQQFELLVGEDGAIMIEESASDAGGAFGRFTDSDGDGFTDADEMAIGTDQFDFRSFPTDIDNDGILDFYDGDIDNDGYLNEDDQFPNDPYEWSDIDNDGIPDNSDQDDDNDGVPDISVNWSENYIIQDLFPNDPNESSDFDRDGIGDNADLDDDNDGFEDSIDFFPYNPYEWLDSDADGIGDNSDTDNDNDGYSDFDEQFSGSDPFDFNDRPSDMDEDFVPDSIDSDIDGDNIPNNFDNAPNFYNPDQDFIEGNEEFIQIESPEFFSPNGDGVNDFWVVKNLERYPNNIVLIYDINGNQVFSQNGYQNDWNGLSQDGQELPRGSYLYSIDLDGKNSNLTQGWIYIVR